MYFDFLTEILSETHNCSATFFLIIMVSGFGILFEIRIKNKEAGKTKAKEKA